MAIEQDFHKFIVNLVANELLSNQVAKIIALNYRALKFQSKDKLLESIVPLFQTYSDSLFEKIQFRNAEPVRTDNLPKDFRIKAVRLANVRGVPAPKGNIMFGFDLEEKDQIQSAVLFGPNGSGKSSIFDSIEYIYTSRVSEKNLRSANASANNAQSFIEYLSHFKNAPECEITTVSGKFSLRNQLFKSESDHKAIFPENHFISDYDIYKKGQLDYESGNENSTSFHTLLASSLGLQEYLDFNNSLKSLSTYRRLKESKRRNEILTQLNNWREELLLANNSVGEKRQTVVSLKSAATSESENVRDQKLRLLNDLRINQFKSVSSREHFLELLDNYRLSFERFVGLSVNIALRDEANFLLSGLELMNHFEGCPFCKNSNSSIGEIKISVERRLADLKEFQFSISELERNIKEIVNQVREFSNAIKLIINSAKLDIRSSIEFPEMNEIRAKEEDFLQFLETIHLDLSSLIDEIEQSVDSSSSVKYKPIEFQKIYNKYETLLQVELPNTPNAIIAFGVEREKFFQSIERSISKTSERTTVNEQIAVLESDIHSLNSTCVTLNNKILILSKELENLEQTIEIQNKIKSEAGELSKVLEARVNEILISTFETIKEPITVILSDYLKEDLVSLRIDIEKVQNSDDPDLYNQIIVAKIYKVDRGTGELISIPPNKYFNTFRYRLFCMMVTLSIALTARINSRINLPLLLDDIFYASDYNSKITFKNFIVNILSIFRKYNGDMPLQFILFTHDELILDSALEAISEFSGQPVDAASIVSEWVPPLADRILVARLFTAEEVDEIPQSSSFGNFWDLTYKIPQKVQVQLLNDK